MAVSKKFMALVGVVLMASAFCLPNAQARRNSFMSRVGDAIESATQPGSITVPATGEIEVAFSPNEGAEALVLKVIDSATKSIRLMAYSFTSAPVTEALLRAKHRGVDIAMVVDYKNNVSQDRSGKARAALSALVNAGVAVRTIDVYAIAHDKVICVDGQHTESGSFNYSSAGAHSNSENVLVVWHNPKLAAVYLKHWERNWNQGIEYSTRY